MMLDFNSLNPKTIHIGAFLCASIVFFQPFTACVADKTTSQTGSIIYGLSNRLMETDLGKKKSKVLYEFDRHVLQPYVGYADAERVVMEIAFVDGHAEIASFSRGTSSLDTICQGERPTYLVKYDMLFFCRDTTLYRKELATNTQEQQIGEVVVGGPRPVQISDSVIAFFNGARVIAEYDIISDSARVTGEPGYVPLAYSAQARELICENTDDFNLYALNIDSLTTRKLDIPRAPDVTRYGIIAHDSKSCIFYTKPRLLTLEEGLRDLYVYWLDENREEKYMDDVTLRNGYYVPEAEEK